MKQQTQRDARPSTQQPSGTDPAGGDGAKDHSPMSRRRMVLSAAGFMLLAVGTTRTLTQPDKSAAMSSTGGTDPHGELAPSPGPSPDAAPHPSPSTGTRPQSRVATAPRYYVDAAAGPTAIALTLDDGPNPVYTPQILNILDYYGIKATFNMIGEQVVDNLSLVREVSAAGHVVTNHTWDHADMRKYTVSRVLSEIDACNDALADANQRPTIFRAPYGYWTPAVFQACAERDLIPLGWSVDPMDWDTDHVDTTDIVNTVMRTTHDHDIILEHDGGGDRSNTVAALRIFIPELLARGFVFTAV